MVCPGFNSSFVLDPYFFEEKLETVVINADRYCEMLADQHVITQLKEKCSFSRTVYQRDGATPHTARVTKDLLRRDFGESRVNSKVSFAPDQ